MKIVVALLACIVTPVAEASVCDLGPFFEKRERDAERFQGELVLLSTSYQWESGRPYTRLAGQEVAPLSNSDSHVGLTHTTESPFLWQSQPSGQ